MNNDLISRSALLRVLPNDGTNLVYNIRKTVENAPAVDVVPIDFHERCLLLEVQKRHAVEANQRHGRWMPVLKSDIFGKEYEDGHRCSECGGESLYLCADYIAYDELSNYCPHCGCKMDVEVEG